ncbi:MFS general substrate transporter [Meredithblackwellia eburnea MCA 4105]
MTQARPSDAEIELRERTPFPSSNSIATSEASQPPPTGPESLTRMQVMAVFGSLSLALGMAFLDQNITGTITPTISAELGGGSQASWISSSFLVAQAAFTPIVGSWSDTLGRRILLLASVALFMLGSLACALARSMTQLIVFRALQGLGGGGVNTMVNVVMSDVVTPRARGKYQAFLEVVTIITSAIGPALGGVFVQGPGWRWSFWINLPIGAAVAITSFIFLPSTAPTESAGTTGSKLAKLDYLGSVLTAVSAVLLMLPLTWGGVSFEWSSGPVVGCLVAGIAGFVSLGAWEAVGAKKPILPMDMLKNVTALSTFFVTLWVGAQFGILLFYVPQLFQITRGLSAVISGALVIPSLVVSSIIVILAGQVQSRTGRYKAIVVVGFALCTIGMGLMSMIDESTSIAKIIGFTIMVGFGQGCVVKTSMVGLQAAVPKSQMASATAFRYFFRVLGSALGLAFSNAVLSNSLSQTLSALNLPSSAVKTVLDNPTDVFSGIIVGKISGLTQDNLPALLDGYASGFGRIFLVMIAPMGVCAVLSLATPQVVIKN